MPKYIRRHCDQRRFGKFKLQTYLNLKFLIGNNDSGVMFYRGASEKLVTAVRLTLRGESTNQQEYSSDNCLSSTSILEIKQTSKRLFKNVFISNFLLNNQMSQSNLDGRFPQCCVHSNTFPCDSLSVNFIIPPPLSSTPTTPTSSLSTNLPSSVWVYDQQFTKYTFTLDERARGREDGEGVEMEEEREEVTAVVLFNNNYGK